MSEQPPGWAEAAVIQLLETTIGGVWGKEPGANEVDAVVIRVADFRDDGSINFDSAPLRSVTPRQLSSRELRVGDILLEKSGGGPTKSVGRVVRMRPTFQPVVPTNFVQLLRPNDEVVESGFLHWWLWFSHLNGAAAEFQRATTNIRNLRTQDYLDRLAPLPPLNEQRRIVAAIEEQLSRLDAADVSLAQATRRLEGLRQSSIAGAVNGEWPLVPLVELLVSLRNGLFVSRPAAEPPGVPIFRISAVRPLALDVDDIRYASVDEVASSDFLVSGGDLLFTRYSGNPEYVGACARVPDGTRPTLHPDKLIRAVVDREKADPAYLEIAWATGVTRDEIRVRRKTTAGQVGIAGGQLKSVRVPVPPLEEQRRIVAEVEARLSVIDAMRASIERAQRRSAALRAAILELAFRGELVPQDPSDEPASILLDRIRAERERRAAS